MSEPKSLYEELTGEADLDRRDYVALLRPAIDAKERRDAAAKLYTAFGDKLRAYLEEHEERLYDGESRVEAYLSKPPAVHNYDLTRASTSVLKALAKAGLLSLDHTALQRLKSPELKDAARVFYHEGSGTRRLTVERIKDRE